MAKTFLLTIDENVHADSNRSDQLPIYERSLWFGFIIKRMKNNIANFSIPGRWFSFPERWIRLHRKSCKCDFQTPDKLFPCDRTGSFSAPEYAYGKWHGELFTEENKKQFLIPRGFAHGFLVLSDTAEFCYKCDDFWYPNDESGIAWNDPEIGIEWPKLEGEYRGSASAEGYTVDGVALNLSDKDQKWLGIKDTFKF